MTEEINGIPTKPLGDKSQLEKIVLERMKASFGKRLGGFALEKAEVHFIAQEMLNGLDVYFQTQFLTETVGEYSKVVNFRCPKSWWQFFKMQCFPKWLLRAFPVKTHLQEEVVVFSVKAVYPQLPMLEEWKDKVGDVYFVHELSEVARQNKKLKSRELGLRKSSLESSHLRDKLCLD